MKHLLVTNDFPPKIGGIQSYLWELWRRLPADEVTVLASAYPGAGEFDRAAGFRIERSTDKVLLPRRAVLDHIEALADEIDADLVLLDPALPVGHLGPDLSRPYGVILHGAEVTVPGRVAGPRHALARVLKGASLVVAAGRYPAAEGERAAGRPLPVLAVPPGVDTDRFVPLGEPERIATRRSFGIPGDADLVVSVSRLVPRKGMDVLIRAAAILAPDHPRLRVVIGGSGRDARRLSRLAAALDAPVSFVGRVPDESLPGLYASADLFVMNCRSRWMGLEQEGFGIVFLEAAACGVPQIAGDSGGAAEAVADGVSGLVTSDPTSAVELADKIASLLSDRELRSRMGSTARTRAVQEFSYDVLAARLDAGLHDWVANR